MTKPVNDLSAEFVKGRISYDLETGILRWKFPVARRIKPGDVIGYPNNNGYLVFSIRSKSYLVHRIAWLIHFGEWPIGDIDHINGNRHDNRIENLRDVDKSQNNHNLKKAKKTSKTKILGVYFHKREKKYRAKIQINGRTVRLGSFGSPELASAAYWQEKINLIPGAEAAAREAHPCGHK